MQTVKLETRRIHKLLPIRATAATLRVSASMVGKVAGRGAFIVFEGVDRSGTSTQSERLVSSLKASGVSLHALAPWWTEPFKRIPERMRTCCQSPNCNVNDDSLVCMYSIGDTFLVRRVSRA